MHAVRRERPDSGVLASVPRVRVAGRNVEQRLTFIVGPKRTGKSKALEISARVLGPDYAIIWQPKLITRSKFGTHHDSETWSITGKRLVAISETDAGMDLDEAMVKNLTGASTMAMRGLYRAKESQVPVTWTIVIGTNEEPNVEKWDDAIGRRVIKIPSGPSLETWEVDLDLEDKILESEAEGARHSSPVLRLLKAVDSPLSALVGSRIVRQRSRIARQLLTRGSTVTPYAPRYMWDVARVA
jgi:phage/plasmid-associated DNA primase